MPMLDTGKDHRKGARDAVVRVCLFPLSLVLGEAEAPIASYPYFLFSCVTLMCPPLLQTGGPVTAIII